MSFSRLSLSRLSSTSTRRMASSATQTKPVLIIGAGLGGLTLAHGLQKAGIPFHIYERDSPGRFQGYRIRVHGVGLQALKDNLPENVYKEFERTCGTQPSELPKMIDAITGETSSMDAVFKGKAFAAKQEADKAKVNGAVEKKQEQPNGKPAGPGSYVSLPVDRRVMRKVLLTGLPEPSFHKALVDYKLTNDGVIARFSDGTTSPEGSLLVGADGANSKVALQLIGSSGAAFDLGSRIIYGRTIVTPQLTERLSPSVQAGMRFIKQKTNKGDLTMFMEVMRFREDVHQDYTFFALVGLPETFGVEDEKLLRMSAEEASELSKRVSRDWLPELRPLLEDQAVEHTRVLPMRTAHPIELPTWTTSDRVTVLGDAVHCMPPTGGSGAILALRDAGELVKTLTTAKIEGANPWTKGSIAEYERGVREAAKNALGQGYGMALKMLGSRPIQGLGGDSKSPA